MADLLTVAALYVERGGVYYGLPGVDPWRLSPATNRPGLPVNGKRNEG